MAAPKRTMQTLTLPTSNTIPSSMLQVTNICINNSQKNLKHVQTNFESIILPINQNVAISIYARSLDISVGQLTSVTGTTSANNYHHYVNVNVANNGTPPNKWNIWQQFQWPVVPPEQNRWSKWRCVAMYCVTSASVFIFDPTISCCLVFLLSVRLF